MGADEGLVGAEIGNWISGTFLMALEPSPAFALNKTAPTGCRGSLNCFPVVRFQGSLDIEPRARKHIRHSLGQDDDVG
jgi:hypothetical protein